MAGGQTSMHVSAEHNLRTLFSTEQHCVSYLFRKRWPRGFICPFCGALHKDMAPAHSVVCQYCRKQTSITAHTLMHGSKKNLIAWMRVAWQFCNRDQGISARELQRLMELSCYHTAWSWLQKIRMAAALAEASPCSGKVVFVVAPLSITIGSKNSSPVIAMALELHHSADTTKRVRFAVLDSDAPAVVEAAIHNLVAGNTTLLIPDADWPYRHLAHIRYHHLQPESVESAFVPQLHQKTELWLTTLFRGAIDILYLQSYLDEFSFRHNTATWHDKLDVLDHLLTGLVAPSKKKAITTK